MALDPKVSGIVDSAVRENEEDEDALIDALENDADLNGLRERRLAQLHTEYLLARQMKENQRGAYEEITDEKVLMDITTSTHVCIVHFCKSDFTRCRIMHRHLKALATIHYEVRFLSIDVSNAPFLVNKLGIQVLPCVLAFTDGKCVERIIGFEGIGTGSSDNFTTKDLELRLLRSDVLSREKVEDGEMKSAHIHRTEVAQKDEDEDDDWV